MMRAAPFHYGSAYAVLRLGYLTLTAVLLGLLVLEPLSLQFSRVHLVRPLLPFLGGVSCLGALWIVFHALFCPDPDEESRARNGRPG